MDIFFLFRTSSLISPELSFFLCPFFILISSDIPYLQADGVSPVVCSLFLLQHDLMRLSNNKREQRKRRVGDSGEGGGRGWEAGLRLGILDSPALSLLSALSVGEKHPTFYIIIKQ